MIRQKAAELIRSGILKTQQGTTSLRSAVSKVAAEPERAAFLGASALNVGASFLGARRIKQVTKPMLLPLLAGRIVRSSATPTDKALGLVGLSTGWLGDLILMKPNSLKQGALGFSGNHVSYCALLVRQGARLKLVPAIVRAIPLLAATALTAQKQPGLTPVVLGYGGLLATASTLADDPSLYVAHQPENFGISHGYNLFLVSDAVLCMRELLLEDDQKLARLSDGFIMGTYVVAQLLLVDGLFPKSR